MASQSPELPSPTVSTSKQESNHQHPSVVHQTAHSTGEAMAEENVEGEEPTLTDQPLNDGNEKPDDGACSDYTTADQQRTEDITSDEIETTSDIVRQARRTADSLDRDWETIIRVCIDLAEALAGTIDVDQMRKNKDVLINEMRGFTRRIEFLLQCVEILDASREELLENVERGSKFLQSLSETSETSQAARFSMVRELIEKRKS
ncbi:uncharacterized protein LY89DRAFT_740501 [Mollisia scopiformis]|uniref:Uncharacterized protein n=1 Tax=Mollisia scopiformis TaxID=149040 RepID=A0A132BCG4_MOLSC|nr:uncharacterized protein LY89DRAFT_740501 [Mollisia scopiformis]KUJ10105.1 hypothetical protein LY89DRAFT_740501 [Mollisia scopiformis]